MTAACVVDAATLVRITATVECPQKDYSPESGYAFHHPCCDVPGCFLGTIPAPDAYWTVATVPDGWTGGDVLAAAKQCRLNPLPNGPGPWLDDCPHGIGEAFIHERRLAARHRLTVEALPVHAVANPVERGIGESWLWLRRSNQGDALYRRTRTPNGIVDEPVSHLLATVHDFTPGRTLLRVTAVEVLDEPVTEMMLPLTGGRWSDHIRVPLALPADAVVEVAP